MHYQYYFFTLGRYSRGSLKIRPKADNEGRITQSVQSAGGKESCNRTALKRCANTEACWNIILLLTNARLKDCFVVL